MNPTFKWDDPNAVIAQVSGLLREQGGRIREIPERAVRRGTFELLALVKQKVPRRTSTLVRSVQAAVTRISQDVIEGRVGTWLKYARYLEEGTGIYGPKGRPILITARKSKGLFWGAYNEKGKAIIRKRVSVRGIKPKTPFQNAMAVFLPRYLEIINQELARGTSAA